MKPAPATTAIALTAIAVAMSPALQEILVFDRDAVGSGELWRIATGSFVHFSRSHLLWDLLVVAAAGSILERGGRPVAGVVVASAVATGAAVFLLDPALARYGGLSGIAYALVVMLAVDRPAASGLTRPTGGALLLLASAKLCWEWWSGDFLLVADAGAAVRAVPLAHLVGGCVGLLAAWPRSAGRAAASVPSPAAARGPGSRS